MWRDKRSFNRRNVHMFPRQNTKQIPFRRSVHRIKRPVGCSGGRIDKSPAIGRRSRGRISADSGPPGGSVPSGFEPWPYGRNEQRGCWRTTECWPMVDTRPIDPCFPYTSTRTVVFRVLWSLQTFAGVLGRHASVFGKQRNIHFLNVLGNYVESSHIRLLLLPQHTCSTSPGRRRWQTVHSHRTLHL